MLESQSKPSNKPSPLMAEVLKIAQSLLLILGRPKPSATAASSNAPGRSCGHVKGVLNTDRLCSSEKLQIFRPHAMAVFMKQQVMTCQADRLSMSVLHRVSQGATIACMLDK